MHLCQALVPRAAACEHFKPAGALRNHSSCRKGRAAQEGKKLDINLRLSNGQVGCWHSPQRRSPLPPRSHRRCATTCQQERCVTQKPSPTQKPVFGICTVWGLYVEVPAARLPFCHRAAELSSSVYAQRGRAGSATAPGHLTSNQSISPDKREHINLTQVVLMPHACITVALMLLNCWSSPLICPAGLYGRQKHSGCAQGQPQRGHAKQCVLGGPAGAHGCCSALVLALRAQPEHTKPQIPVFLAVSQGSELHAASRTTHRVVLISHFVHRFSTSAFLGQELLL